MYRPLPHYLTIKKSGIEGLGLFAKRKLYDGTFLGISHVKDDSFEDGYIRTPLGGFINHSDNPNCEWYTDGRVIKLRTIKDISLGEELTLKYKWYEPNNE